MTCHMAAVSGVVVAVVSMLLLGLAVVGVFGCMVCRRGQSVVSGANQLFRPEILPRSKTNSERERNAASERAHPPPALRASVAPDTYAPRDNIICNILYRQLYAHAARNHVNNW